MSIVMGIVGILFTIFLAWIASSNRKLAFKHWKNILILLVLQLLAAFLFLSTTGGQTAILWLAEAFDKLLGFAREGGMFVFGDLMSNAEGEAVDVFLFNVLVPIIFISAIIGILSFTRILPFIIKGIGFLLTKITGMPYIESYNGAASMMLGQSEVFVSLKNQLPKMTTQRLYTLSAQAMSSISLSIVGAFFTMLDPQFVIIAIILNLFGVYIIVHIINPYEEEVVDGEVEISTNPEKGKSFFQVLGDYILDGGKIVLVVGAMLIGFIALIALLNDLFLLIPGSSLTFQDILGYIFMPVAFMMGIPWDEAQTAGSLMATKLITNEFVAILEFIPLAETLSEKTQAMLSVFLISFANFGSIGIIAGSVKGLHNESGDKVAKFGLKLVYGATLVSILSSVIIGFFY
ncbi:Nucleoside permease NupC [Jeotgalicoccus aerolatus]|uniref:Nucleoside transport protein n=1 Tax=Jeotgalicoccus aerolatus TaxID=709510 RepID=A0A1G9B3D5_9STAP|nr:nucleoside transporter C-terminal domain-containing protein [Jeotgalicoccus aerolatus]MBP1952008.1 nucleoside transport protein [Jeotgalicoccus aerolatus]CAD2071301.1 Nucleoside permease NupC [Jeotgalicoccus aerolatus]SDK34062.1 nucleoside transport protein [Jeotgalicoccus aerolatus]GGE05192.1 pyrimidine nucleoside transporter NupC [Jeotgalicoccus aerolatus]HJG32650.1 NupC/NupG family nucleoside CNT transporter [Jeotgalicoccus aerolatus]